MMSYTRILAGSAFLAGATLSTVANAQQPLAVVVQPVTTVLSAPFVVVGGILSPRPATGTYDDGPARRAATGYTSYNWAIVRPGVLRETGPRYANPANADYRNPIVLRRGSTVPGYVNTAPVANISTPGMVQNARYEFFVSPQQRVVFLDPTTRQVVQIR